MFMRRLVHTSAVVTSYVGDSESAACFCRVKTLVNTWIMFADSNNFMYMRPSRKIADVSAPGGKQVNVS